MTVDAKRLRHVGLSAKAAALLTKPVAPDMVWGPVQSAQDGDYRAEYALGPERLYLADDPGLTHQWTPLSDTLEYARGWVRTGYDPLVNGFFGSNNGDVVVRPILYADNYAGEVASGDPHPAFAEALKAYPSPNFPPHDNELPPPSTRDLLRAGLSIRQAKTWLKVLGMGAPTSWRKLYTNVGGGPQDVWALPFAWLGGHVNVWDDTGNDYIIEPIVDPLPDFDTVFNSTILPVEYENGGGASWGNQSGDLPAGEYWVIHVLPTGSPEPEDVFSPAQGRAPGPDPRLKTLIHGGFTTAQARLLLELL